MLEIQFVERNGEGCYVCQFADQRDERIRLRLTDVRLDRLRIDATTQFEFSVASDVDEGRFQSCLYEPQRRRINELFDRLVARQATAVDLEARRVTRTEYCRGNEVIGAVERDDESGEVVKYEVAES